MSDDVFAEEPLADALRTGLWPMSLVPIDLIAANATLCATICI
jgi:hypothetical protein